MTYNDGKIHDDFYEDKENLNKVAEEFSEGNPVLANTLLTLWNAGIKTSGCCNGHENIPISYLNILIDENSRDLINSICSSINYFDKMEIDFTRDQFNNRNSFNVNMPIENRDEILTFISNCITKKTKMEENNRMRYAELLLDYAHEKSLNLRYAIDSDDNQAFSFYQPGVVQIFDENILPVEVAVEQIKKENQFRSMPYSCSDESLESFISTIYPNINFNNSFQANDTGGKYER